MSLDLDGSQSGSVNGSNGPTILLNDAPLRPSQEFEALPSEEAGLMTDEEAFYYDRNYSRSRQVFGPLQDIWSSIKRQTGLANGVHKRTISIDRNLGPRRRLRRVGLFALMFLALLGVVQLITVSHGAFVAFFPAHRNKVLTSWAMLGKGRETIGLKHWPTDFTADVLPIPCHSHNDYWRPVPLFSGVSAGCISTEADVWLHDGELYVGHDESSLTVNRTLNALYLDPLIDMLDRQNPSTEFTPDDQTSMNGIFDTDRGQVLTLLIDVKTEVNETFEAVVKALEPLRKKGYLTHHDGNGIVQRPLRIIGTGNTQFSTILSDLNSHKDIFMDAPLQEMFEEPASEQLSRDAQAIYASRASPDYSINNSYYASTSFTDAIGYMWGWSLSKTQLRKLRGQVKGAHARGLKVRYWELPAWPVSRRNALWKILVEEGVDILNVDDLQGAVNEDWSRAGRWWD